MKLSSLAIVLATGLASCLALALGAATPHPSRAQAAPTEVELAPSEPAPPQAGCGNYRCEPPEDCRSCPADCGDCCGNNRCEPPEDCRSCPRDCGDCCGDRRCAPPEDCRSCPSDCGPC